MSTHPSALPRPPWPGTARSRSRPIWLPLLLLVAVAHLLLLQLVQHALRPARTPTAAPHESVLVLLPPVVLPHEVPPPAEPDEPKRRPRRLTKPPRPAPAAPAAPTAAPADTAAAAAPAARTPEPAPQAAAPAPAGGKLLDSDASRKAIREAARKPSMADLGAQASGANAALSEQEQLGREIARGAIGDCLKGEYAGSGMGLLSLPFWLMAELRDKCRR